MILPRQRNPRRQTKMDDMEIASAEDWLLLRVGILPKGSLGWFRAGVGFYNKKQYTFSIECFERAVAMDPLNFNAYQIMARACIAVNRRDDGEFREVPCAREVT